MKYIAVKWKHSDPNYPVLLYSELDDANWEVRKIEVFADGRRGYADRTGSHGGTRLGVEPLPSLAEIATDPQFEPTEISHQDFEQVWAARS